MQTTLSDLAIRVRKFLVEKAHHCNTLTYSDLNVNQKLGLNYDNAQDVQKVSDLLDIISRYEHKCNRPLLSAIVVHSEDYIQGKGFISMMKELKIKNIVKDPVVNSSTQIKACHDYWNNEENYSKYKDI